MIKILKKHYLLILLFLAAFLVRFLYIDFPDLTPDEARIFYRGYTLAVSGKDELGRAFPLLFNSLEDYQLPLVSYLSAGGEFLFGKNDLGARIPFILIGAAIVPILFKLSKLFNKDVSYPYFVSLAGVFSPALVFLSKVPNEAIVLTFLITLLLYLLLKGKNALFIILIMVLTILTSKSAWFILIPLILSVSYFYLKDITLKKKAYFWGSALLLSILAFTIFLNIPQGKRSFLENNFPLFSEMTIKNGIDRLRGQGLQSGWPGPLERILFNKIMFLVIGALQWLSHLNPSLYFGQLDYKGLFSFSFTGAFSKILVIPFFLGIWSLFKKPGFKSKTLLIIPLALTLPAFFVFPGLSLDLAIVTIPFMSLIIGFGFLEIRKFRKLTLILIFLMVTELFINISTLDVERRNTNSLRAGWIREVTVDIYGQTNLKQSAVSDDIVEEITPYIYWYNSGIMPFIGEHIPWPYKYRQYNLGNIRIIGSEEKFRPCTPGKDLTVYASLRDLRKIQEKKDLKITKSYTDYLGEEKVFKVENICLEL